MRKILILLNLVLFSGALLYSIYQKEELIANGERLLLRLAPVDPRSLMQGDFMRLDYELARAITKKRPKNYRFPTHQAIITLDSRGVATFVSLATRPLQKGEKLLNFKTKHGRVMIVSDAWFFQEGEAKKFEKAQYGEFRILPDGKALLVGMMDKNLNKIE